jgi:putative ABC transport system permease protein
MTTFLHDIRYSIRMLLKNPSVTCIMIFSLALAVGANTAIFSVVYGVLLRPLPYPNPDQIMTVNEVSAKGSHMNFAEPNFHDARSMNHTLQGMAEYEGGVTSVSGTAEPTRTFVAPVSKDFFTVLGVHPFLGRDFASGDQILGAAPVALVSENFWRQNLGSPTDLSQSKLKIEKRVYSVVGVLPAGFHFPATADIWYPTELEEPELGRTAHNWRVIARLRDGVSLDQARGDLSSIGKGLGAQYAGEGPYVLHDIAITPLQETMTTKIRPALILLLGAVGFLLLVACANVANLLVSQASARDRELAIRSALGAARGRLVRQFLTEALVLSIAGGFFGVLAAVWGVDALIAIAPKDLPRLESVAINLPVLFFAFAICVAVAFGLGVFTAMRATSGDLRGALVEGGRGQAGSQSSHRLGRAIVAAQIAITLALLVGAGLLGRSLFQVLSVDPGFRTEHVLTMGLDMPWGVSWDQDPAAKARQAVQFNEIFTRLRQVPGVAEVGAATDVPLDEGLPDGLFVEASQNDLPKKMEDFGKLWKDASRTGEADFCAATNGYFRALGIHLIRGRVFDDRDGYNAPHVAVISESLARIKWPKQDPIGHTIEFGNMDGNLQLLTIVGIVGDIREYALETPARPTVYVNLLQRPRSSITVVMRADSDPQSVFSAARGIVRDIAPEVPPNFRTFTQVYSASIGSRRFNMILVGAFAATALLLAIAGIYGVMSYTVIRRTREIGVRMALGAAQTHVLGMILKQGMFTALIGLAIGVAGSLALTRLMQSLLFGVTATDPITFGVVVLLLTFVALLASYLPARRATQVDPVIALRNE